MIDSSFRYTWLIWACAFMVPWTAFFIAQPMLRSIMLKASILTAPFGLTEPLFVPEYWNPPSLFDLAQRTGFDIESLIFCFAIGGIGVVAYRSLLPGHWRGLHALRSTVGKHRFHRLALVRPFFLFALLIFAGWNPIYPSVAALVLGAVATITCRPELLRNSLIGGAVFLVIYIVFLVGLKGLWPGYIESVWNTATLIAWQPFGFPIEELLFAFGFGMYWSTVYEHLTWKTPLGDES